MIDLTKDNVDSQSFEFTFDYSENWFYAVVKVTVRPRNEQLSAIRDRVGGCMDQCQEALPSFHIRQTAMRAAEEKGALVYRLRVPRWANKRCFFFWISYERPGQDIWMIRVDSPLVKSGTPE